MVMIMVMMMLMEGVGYNMMKEVGSVDQGKIQ
jgi:hypothetical protein